MHRMIPVKEIARTLGLAEDYLVALCEQGRLPAQKTPALLLLPPPARAEAAGADPGRSSGDHRAMPGWIRR